jgi:hypothetical protein
MKAALDNALEIRKFEVELYWKRAQYFWAFLVTIYGAYFVVYSKADVIDDIQKPLMLLGLATLGMLFSLGWFLANKGSKFWEKNWELHVAVLEDYVYGPLYKTVIAKTDDGKKFLGSWISPVSPLPISVSNINCVLSVIVSTACILLWGMNMFKFVLHLEPNISPEVSLFIAKVGIMMAAGFMLLLGSYCKGGIAKEFEANRKEKEQPVFFMDKTMTKRIIMGSNVGSNSQ